MRARHIALAVLLIATPAAAQQQGAGTGGKEGQQNLRSFIVRNDSQKVISEVWLGSTNGGKELFSTKEQIRPNHTVNLRVGRDECLAQVRVRFDDGSDLRAENLNECKLTRISVNGDKIALQSSAVE